MDNVKDKDQCKVESKVCKYYDEFGLNGCPYCCKYESLIFAYTKCYKCQNSKQEEVKSDNL